MAERKNKRIIIPDKPKQVKSSNIILVPSVENLLTDALSVIGNEVARLKQKSDRSTGALTAPEARVLQGYIRSLVELSKEAREREAGEDLSELSDTEILETLLQNMDSEELQDLFRRTMRKKEREVESD